ncbi:PIN domain-containing protein [Rhodoferax aquaticus]|uniref:NYN domain-containing protein n=1 Tax=Rhodoferax aquaticus TaxID=2527691 RepID=A0A515EQU2_9BURK|nr:PIN domain-containing protein [Rhodoferax aquaticus]QDL54985.1 NYN domain-containing protein [Rhodoferax aquaticus]
MAMTKKLLLVDLENVQKIDLSLLDESYRAIIFVGAKQNPPKAAKKQATAHRFERVDFQKIEGSGKNALDFHIAFQLGRTIETAPETECVVLSGDKGFDPLLAHLNKNGLVCRRVKSMADLVASLEPIGSIQANDPERTVCPMCHKASTIEHHGGRWCSNCGSFAVRPDPSQLPSAKLGINERRTTPLQDLLEEQRYRRNLPTCGWCNQKKDMSGGIYDDGEWMCGDCVAGYAT